MARFLGIDIGARTVRAALINTGYRKLAIERLEEAAIESPELVTQAIAAAASSLIVHIDGVATALDGDRAFVHRISLPPTATKQLAEVLPFELESQVPVDIDELVYDYRLLPRPSDKVELTVLVAAARVEHVRARIELVKSALGREPDRVSCGSIALANLAVVVPNLRGPGPIALIDLGGRRTEVTLIERGDPVVVRTLSRGVEGLPGTAAALAAEIRQTLLAWASNQNKQVQAIYLVGGGAAAEGADRFLSHELGVPVEALPPLTLEGVGPEQLGAIPRFAKAIALALGAAGRGHDVDLRRGPLAFQRGYGFLKEKAPLLVGLGAATVVSFLFATWAEVRALDRENAVLVDQLAVLSKQMLGEEVREPEAALGLLEKARAADEVDPLPTLDAFDVIVEISKVVPTTVTHDIEEFDMQRGHVKVHGIVGKTNEAQDIATELAKHRCFQGAKISKITQQINSERQKYVLELDVKCPDDRKKKKKPEEGAEKPKEGTETKP
jgi:general secretion pathway protein L